MSYDLELMSGVGPAIQIDRTPAENQFPNKALVSNMAPEPVGHYVQPMNLWIFGGQIAELPGGIYVQMLPQMRHVQVKKEDDTWVRVVVIAGENRVGIDGLPVMVGEY